MDPKDGIIFILIVAVVVIGVLYGLKTCETCPTIEEYKKLVSTDIAGGNLSGGVVGSFDKCKKSCEDTIGCNAFVMDKEESKYCFLKQINKTTGVDYKPELTTYYQSFRTFNAATPPST